MTYAIVTTPAPDGFKPGDIVSWPMAANQTFASGSLVNTDATMRAVPFTARQSAIFLGVADETRTSTAVAGTIVGPDAAGSIRILTAGSFVFDCAGADASWLGVEVYANTGSSGTNRTVVNTNSGLTAATKVGRVVEVISATKVRVRIDGYAMKEVGA